MRKLSYKVNERGVRAHEKKSPVGSFLSSGNGIKSGIPGAFFEQEEKPEKSGTLVYEESVPLILPVGLFAAASLIAVLLHETTEGLDALGV